MMANNWKEFIHKLLMDSNQIEFSHEETINSTLINYYKYTIDTNESLINVGYLENGRLIYIYHTNKLTPGYNEYNNFYFTDENDFDNTNPGIEIGYKFNKMNCNGIVDMLSEGVRGKEIQFLQGEKVLKSSVWINEIEFYFHFDFTNRTYWQKYFGPKIRNMPGVIKKTIDLSIIFPGIKMTI